MATAKRRAAPRYRTRGATELQASGRVVIAGYRSLSADSVIQRSVCATPA